MSYDGLVLLFATAADPSRAARLHAVGCPMVRTGGKGKSTRVITTDLAYNVEDLNERGYPVKRCKCCKAAS